MTATLHKKENQLLRLCCRIQVDTDCAAQIAALCRQNLDWQFVLKFAHMHSVVPLVHRSLAAYGSAPASIMERLHKTRNLNTINLLSRVGSLTAIIAAMRAAGIEALPYKGPVLAAFAYGDMSLRMCGDIDLMVRSGDVEQATDVLTGLGYRRFTEPGRIPDVGDDADPDAAGIDPDIDELSYHREFASEDRQTIVELHWHVQPKYMPINFDIGGLWEQLVPVPFAGMRVLSIPAEPLLVLLCAHGTKHLWNRLMWLCDIAELIRKHPDLDWRMVDDVAEAMGTKRNLAAGLWLAHSLLQARIPADVLASCPGLVRSVASAVARDTLEKIGTRPDRVTLAMYNTVIVQRQDTRLAAIRARVSGR